MTEDTSQEPVDVARRARYERIYRAAPDILKAIEGKRTPAASHLHAVAAEGGAVAVADALIDWAEQGKIGMTKGEMAGMDNGIRSRRAALRTLGSGAAAAVLLPFGAVKVSDSHRIGRDKWRRLYSGASKDQMQDLEREQNDTWTQGGVALAGGTFMAGKFIYDLALYFDRDTTPVKMQEADLERERARRVEVLMDAMDRTLAAHSLPARG